MSRRILPALAAVALALGVAACGDEGDGPVTTPPPPVGNGPSDGGGPSQEPSDGGGEATEDPTVAAPDVPAPDPSDYPGMDEETPEGAEQAFRYYIAVVYWGYQTGDTETLETLHTENCGTCEEFRSDIQELRDADAHWGKTDITDFGVKNFEAPEFDIEVGYIFTIEEHVEPELGTGKQVDVPDNTYTAAAGLLWTDAGWLVGGLNITETQIEID